MVAFRVRVEVPNSKFISPTSMHASRGRTFTPTNLENIFNCLQKKRMSNGQPKSIVPSRARYRAKQLLKEVYFWMARTCLGRNRTPRSFGMVVRLLRNGRETRAAVSAVFSGCFTDATLSLVSSSGHAAAHSGVWQLSAAPLFVFSRANIETRLCGDSAWCGKIARPQIDDRSVFRAGGVHSVCRNVGMSQRQG